MLYLVPTPIGNLGDMTLRAVETLKSVSAVYCEDTRRTRNLMTHFGISKPLFRYHEHHEEGSRRLLDRLKGGETLALVSDGGMPCVSDPGRRIVALARQEKIPVTALPGANAATTALVGSGLPADSFIFLGFLPRSSSKRQEALRQAAVLEKTLIVYESPFRVVEFLLDAEAALGPQAQVCAARELSKIHEEWLSGTVVGVRETLAARGSLMGEFVIVLHPKPRPNHE